MRKFVVVFLIALLLVPALVSAVKLTIYCGGGTERRGLEALVAEYKKLHPDVDFEIIDISYSSYMQKISLAVMSGDVPDLMTITYPFAPALREYLIDLDPYIEKYLGITPEEFEDAFYDVVKPYIKDENGKIKYVPLHFTVQGLWVNVDYFEKAGIPFPPFGGRKEPWTWEEFVDVLRRVKEANNLPYAMSIQYSAERIANYLAIRGAKVLDENLNLVLDKDPKAIKALEDFVNLFKENLCVPAEWISGQSADNDFYGGVTAVYWAGSWETADALDAAESSGKRFEPAYLPKDVYCFGVEGGRFFGAFKTGDKKKEEEAAKFALWAGWKGKGYDIYLKTTLHLSAYKGHKVDYGVPIMEHVQEVFGYLAANAPEWIVTVRANPVWSKLYDPLRKQISLVIAGQQDLQTALKNIRAEYERIIEELGIKK
ncbi:sugar ABC transporter substrate-binding protein [Thermotoga sp. RQ7]|jgi:alpha-1,4-digalacturonate transport system substrate-binding protein|uniref:ABC transporter substrate-binding protein n=1 Tax=Thermotoga sp. RQ7 TaxID=126738 RepID=UPI0005A359A7|nr:ABC transporter substrate-binding protein [Thermotoga sp. RQ7]AJG40373.1 sugar ABC transporter substrate-binding protein [Thermotoga sp. RQ7]